MKKSTFIIAALCCAAVWAAEPKSKPESSILPASAYRVPLDEILVEGRRPYWQDNEQPRFDKKKVEAPKPGEATSERLQWAPAYTRDEREDYAEPRDQLNPKPRAKVFEIRF